MLRIPSTGLEVTEYGENEQQSSLRAWLEPDFKSQKSSILSSGYAPKWFRFPLNDYMVSRKQELLIRQDKLSCGQAYAMLREVEKKEAYNWAGNRSNYMKKRLRMPQPHGINAPLVQSLVDYVKSALQARFWTY